MPLSPLASLATASAAPEHLGETMPTWSMAPFALLLILIAVMPLIAPRFWEHNRNKAIICFALGAPVVVVMAWLDLGTVLHTLHEYTAFIILLAALFVISGGIVIRGTFSGTPGVNTALLAIGAALASFIGTTGASMLLIRPLLRANSVRARKAHVVVFFIFIVSNIGGLLTPLGDPPLFLGYLRGVPFTWTFRLAPQWLFLVAILLVLFYIIDSTIFRREDLDTPANLDVVAVAQKTPISVAGKHNLFLLLAIVLIIYFCGTFKPPLGVQELGMLAVAVLSWVTTKRALHRENTFTLSPIVEVAVIFAGIFAAMIPALLILNAKGAALGLHAPWHFFWATGLLSSFLDNAPTYLTFTSTASGLLGTNAADLTGLVASVEGTKLLAAISLGAVFMGANTYIGNGPNFMVKAVAEHAGVRMPGFFGYMLYSAVILLPLFVILTLVFLL